MSDDFMKQEDIDALLGGSGSAADKGKGEKAGDKGQSAEEPAGGMDQSAIDALLGGMGTDAQSAAPAEEAPAGGLLDQSDIDALMGATGQTTPQIDTAAVMPGEDSFDGAEIPGAAATGRGEDLTTYPEDDLSDVEKDALGEIGNISMGSASTTLSLLLNHKVNITSPKVVTTTVKDLFLSFDAPYMTIYIKYIDGLTGFNLLIMRLDDAAILADLMMGGEGEVTTTDELTEMGISAASEAMNQMIGSASTSMASMFGTVVNISPPETYVSRQTDEMLRLQDMVAGYVVVASFSMTVGEVLDTKIMQVMGIETARETAKLIMQGMYGMEDDTPPATTDMDMVDIDRLIESPMAPVQATPEPTAAAPPPPPLPPAPTPARPAAVPIPIRADVDQARLDMLLDIPLKATALLGRTKWSIKDVLGIVPGSVVELDSMVDEPVEILINGILVAMGEVVVVNENFGVRITSIIAPEERLKRLMQRKFAQ